MTILPVCEQRPKFHISDPNIIQLEATSVKVTCNIMPALLTQNIYI